MNTARRNNSTKHITGMQRAKYSSHACITQQQHNRNDYLSKFPVKVAA